MKADGVEYEERMELLDGVTYPKPLADTLDAAYDIYRRGHPWVLDYSLSPKSVVRDMYERALTFPEYVAFYGLSRSEGLVLRYLADAFKALRQTVPDEAKTEELTDLIEWLGEVVRQVDSSLLDEWERLRNPAAGPGERAETGRRVTSNIRAFRVLVATRCSTGSSWPRSVTTRSWERWRGQRLGRLRLGRHDGGYFEVHDEIGTGPEARGPGLLIIDQRPAAGRSGRSSTTPRATTTGASAPWSTWPPPTRPARP